MIYFLLFLTIIIIIIKNIYELHDYNLDAIVIELQNSNPIMIQEYYYL